MLHRLREAVRVYVDVEFKACACRTSATKEAIDLQVEARPKQRPGESSRPILRRQPLAVPGSHEAWDAAKRSASRRLSRSLYFFRPPPARPWARSRRRMPMACER